MRYEHLKTLLVDEEALELLGEAAERLANADMPPEVTRALALGRMTALQKSGAQRRVLPRGSADALRQQVALLRLEVACPRQARKVSQRSPGNEPPKSAQERF